MNDSIINSGLAFIEGIALIASPCILPILPIMLSGSLESGRTRPYGIILGFIVSFALFTFFSRKLVQISGIDLNIVRNISFGILILFGIIMISSYLTECFARLTQRIANIGFNFPMLNDQTRGGFLSGFVFGGLIGLVWTPCAGPILAAVIVQTVIQKTTFGSFLTVLSFGVGAALPMLIIVLFGREITHKLTFFKRKADLFRKILGGIIIASVFFMIYSDSLAFTVSKSNTESSKTHLSLVNEMPSDMTAPEIIGIEAWINSKPLQLSQLKGKVVLIDFWAYSCINCIRTLPYLKAWDKKYRDQGLVIIGVHSPEFDFEKKLDNVKTAIQKFDIQYPVALDNDFLTWQNYNNRYWPAHYLINKEGKIVYEHFGEGEYDTMENNIEALLGVKNVSTVAVKETAIQAQTPETYLGYARANAFASSESIAKDQESTYTYPDKLDENTWGLQGGWKITPQKIISTKAGAAIKIHFSAAKVYAVMRKNSDKSIQVKLLLNGKPVKNGTIEVSDDRLYTLIEMPSAKSGILELIATEPGLEIYTFTFG